MIMPEFEVENRFSYYQNYNDNIMSGSAKPPWGGGWNRGVVGSVVSGSEEFKAANLLSVYTFDKANPFFRSGEIRFIKLASSTQTIKDTITPDIVKLYTTGAYGSGSLVGPDIGGGGVDGIPNSLRLLFSIDGAIITGSFGAANQRVNNTEWCQSYPYEKKYSFVTDYYTKIIPPFIPTFYEKIVGGIPPMRVAYDKATISEITNDTRYIIYQTITSSAIKTNYVYIDYFGYYNESTDQFVYTPYSPTSYSTTSANKSLAQKVVFGINPKPINSNKVTFSDGVDVYVMSTGSVIQGWKYGLYNGIPTNFSAIFRQGKFGQFRDMLEQRIFTKTYNNPRIGGPLDNNGGINFISGSALVGESNNWLTASIYGSSNVAAAYAVNPYGSGIFDKEYRASQPWHDDDPRLGT